jgi:CRISPR-associated exonuclease Cas4
MISALQHLAFCERQCALIHVEQLWAENRLTVLGELLHEKVHSGSGESRKDIRVARSLRLVSYRLGLVGQFDVVEFRKCHQDEEGVMLPRVTGRWRPFPVEYKKGKPKADSIDEVQLCAQAICLEEQLNTYISEGALFYGEKRRRQPVIFEEQLREKTRSLAVRLHHMIDSGETPVPVFGKKCRSCSLVDMCNPTWKRFSHRREGYEKRLFDVER